tara:strand:+ start:677 stop:1648 length:972 start_codon:yes stop_codon:yes gene_type:complete
MAHLDRASDLFCLSDEELAAKLASAQAELAGGGVKLAEVDPIAPPASRTSAADVYGFAASSSAKEEEAPAPALPRPTSSAAARKAGPTLARLAAESRATDAIALIWSWVLRQCGGSVGRDDGDGMRREQYFRFHGLLQQFMSASHGAAYDPARSAEEAAADWLHDLGRSAEEASVATMPQDLFKHALLEFAAVWAGDVAEAERVYEAVDLLECAALFFGDLRSGVSVAVDGGGGAAAVDDAPAALEALSAQIAAGRASIEREDASARSALNDARAARQARIRSQRALESEVLKATNEARLREVRDLMAESGLYKSSLEADERT